MHAKNPRNIIRVDISIEFIVRFYLVFVNSEEVSCSRYFTTLLRLPLEFFTNRLVTFTQGLVPEPNTEPGLKPIPEEYLKTDTFIETHISKFKKPELESEPFK